MKNNLKPSFFYSAYPLRAIEKAVISARDGQPSPRLKALLSAEELPQEKRLRVYSMITPYKNILKALTTRIRKPKEVEPVGREWFANYE